MTKTLPFAFGSSPASLFVSSWPAKWKAKDIIQSFISTLFYQRDPLTIHKCLGVCFWSQEIIFIHIYTRNRIIDVHGELGECCHLKSWIKGNRTNWYPNSFSIPITFLNLLYGILISWIYKNYGSSIILSSITVLEFNCEKLSSTFFYLLSLRRR